MTKKALTTEEGIWRRSRHRGAGEHPRGDDDERNITVVESVLADPGYRIAPATSGDRALLALMAEEFAVLVLDVQMPGITGFELAEMIRQCKRTASIPIIFLTAIFNDNEIEAAGYSTGAVDYLHKPVNPTVLRSKSPFLQICMESRSGWRTKLPNAGSRRPG